MESSIPTSSEASRLLPDATGRSPILSRHRRHDASGYAQSAENDDDADDADNDRESGPPNVRIAAAMSSFAIMGVINASLGVMVVPLKQHYHLTDVLVSLAFLSAPVGYVAAAFAVHKIHVLFGQRGIAVIAPACQLLFAIVTAIHPPFPVILAAMVVGSFGTALLDESWCSWAASLKDRPNTIQGFLHGSYSIGSCVGPLFAGALLEQLHAPWHIWYAILSAVIVLELCVLFWAFRHQDAAKARLDALDNALDAPSAAKQHQIFRYRATWTCAAYFLVYVGIETAVTDWLVSFLMRSRHATASFSSICLSFFGAGMALGRLGLGAVSDKIGLRRAVTGYILMAMLSGMAFAIVTHPAASIVFISLNAIMVGPLFPSGIVALTRALPKDLHIPAVAFAATVGQAGGAAMPFGTGVLVQALGISVFEVIIFILLITTLLAWLAFPTPKAGKVWSQDNVQDGVVSP